QVDDRVDAGQLRPAVQCIANGPGVCDGAPDVARPVDPGGPALQSGHRVTRLDESAGHRGPQEARGPGHQAVHRLARRGMMVRHGVPTFPPASTRSAQRARRDRSIFELWRMSVGNVFVTSTAATSAPDRSATMSRTSVVSARDAGPSFTRAATSAVGSTMT